jgi:cell division septation protein DedD
MFESRHRSSGGSNANRWLIVAGAGLVILAFVARMLLDIGHTKVSDLAAVMRPDTATAAAPAPAPPEPVIDTLATPPPAPVVVTPQPPVLKRDTTAQRAPSPRTVPAPPTTPSVTPAPAPPNPAGSGYTVQIGAFGSEANATKLSERASALGYTAKVIPQVRGASTLYVVRVKALSANEARQAADSLARSLGVKSVVVPPGK